MRSTPHLVAGEQFILTVGRASLRLDHPRWSLGAKGRTLGEAEVRLAREAGIVVRVFGAIPAAQLDDEALAQLAFALRIALD
jgi:hypothetical protein